MRWDEDSAVTIVMAAKGYPNSYEKGSRIYGADQLETASGRLVSHAGQSKCQWPDYRQWWAGFTCDRPEPPASRRG